MNSTATLETDGDVLDETLPLERVLFAVEPAKQLRLIVLDACRDNPFAEMMKRTVGSRGIGRGLAKVEPNNPNTVIAFAAKAGSTASLNAHENEPTCAQFNGPTECAGMSNCVSCFEWSTGWLTGSKEHASALMGMTGPFAWPR